MFTCVFVMFPERKDLKTFGESLLIHLATMHRVPRQWLMQ